MKKLNYFDKIYNQHLFISIDKVNYFDNPFKIIIVFNTFYISKRLLFLNILY